MNRNKENNYNKASVTPEEQKSKDHSKSPHKPGFKPGGANQNSA